MQQDGTVQGQALPAMQPGGMAAPALRRDAARHLALAGLLTLAGALAIAAGSGLGALYGWQVVLAFAVSAGLVWAGLPAHAPHIRFGPANAVTLGRLCLSLWLAGAVVQAGQLSVWWVWACVVLATLTACLDAIDGWLARRSGLASAYGARFDMETDAWLILVLSALVWQLDKAGAWVLLAGVLRYAFVAAMAFWPWWRRPLPPSLRRKTVCVVQIVGLIVCLGPVILPPWSSAIAAATVAALVASFAVDVAWLVARRQQTLEMNA